MNKDKKYKLVKLKKAVIALGLTATMLLSGTTAFIIKTVHDYSSGSSISKTYDEEKNNNSYVDSDSDYIDVTFSNEKQSYIENKNSTKLFFDKSNYNYIINELNKDDYGFSMSKYYDLDNTLSIYNSTKQDKQKNYEIIVNGKIDSDKLYNVVISNNEKYMQQDKSLINTFFSQTTNENIKNICDLIADIFNNNEENHFDISKIGETLTHLKIFQHNTSSANAYVNDDLVLAFNPNMIKMFTSMQELRENANDGVDVDKTIFVHEIEHIFQNASNDFNKENGVEAGICRKYDNANVNSLWNSWLLEGSAEIKMSEILNTTPKNYQKKISYIRSYNLSRLFDDDYNINDLINSAYANDINSAFNMLNLNNEKEKRDFLNLMYSIEITQSNVDDFWKFYQEQEGVTLTDEEKNSIRMDIRTDAVKNLSGKFYAGLAKGLLTGKIKDVETLFYFMRLWELDCQGHLLSTSKQGLEHSKEFIIWQDSIEKAIIKSISNNDEKRYQELLQKYDDYHMIIKEDEKEINNADFSGFNKNKQEYIKNLYTNYSITFFAKLNEITNYINREIEKKSSMKIN